jgi:hypothetical protein
MTIEEVASTTTHTSGTTTTSSSSSSTQIRRRKGNDTTTTTTISSSTSNDNNDKSQQQHPVSSSSSSSKTTTSNNISFQTISLVGITILVIVIQLYVGVLQRQDKNINNSNDNNNNNDQHRQLVFNGIDGIVSSSNNGRSSKDQQNDKKQQKQRTQCRIYLAPSSVKGLEGYGIFTTEDMKAGEIILSKPDGPSIPVVDYLFEPSFTGDFGKLSRAAWIRVWDNYWWGRGVSDVVLSESQSNQVIDYQIMFGSLPNHHCILHVLDHTWSVSNTTPYYDDTMDLPNTSPGTGAYSYYAGRNFFVKVNTCILLIILKEKKEFSIGFICFYFSTEKTMKISYLKNCPLLIFVVF